MKIGKHHIDPECLITWIIASIFSVVTFIAVIRLLAYIIFQINPKTVEAFVHIMKGILKI